MVAQNIRENKDQVQSSEQKALRLSLVLLTVSHSQLRPMKTDLLKNTDY